MKKSKNKTDDPFAGCILAEAARRGELPSYHYTPNGLPKLRVKLAPGWTPFSAKPFKEDMQKATRRKPGRK